MKRGLILCSTLVMTGGWFGGCVTAHRPAATVVPEADHFIGVHMVDSRNGWAQAGGPGGLRVLRTTDGALNWLDVTPHPFPDEPWDYQFLNGRVAWISFRSTNTTCWLLTTNGGELWGPWAPLGVHSKSDHNDFLAVRTCRFFNAREGLAECIDGALGSSYYTLFETHDGGLNWEAVPVTPPGGNPENPPGEIPISNMMWYGSGISYCPPGKVVIVHGDPFEGKPEGIACLSLSTNLGKSWRELRLHLPDKYRESLCAPSPPFFFDPRNGLLPVCAFKPNTNNSSADREMIFYATRDGGSTWAPRPGTLGLKGYSNNFNFVSPKDLFIQEEGSLYVTHDGAREWRRIQLDFDLRGGKRRVARMDFVDATHGWIAVSEQAGMRVRWHGPRRFYPYLTLYKTSDSGRTWTELAPQKSPGKQ